MKNMTKTRIFRIISLVALSVALTGAGSLPAAAGEDSSDTEALEGLEGITERHFEDGDEISIDVFGDTFDKMLYLSHSELCIKGQAVTLYLGEALKNTLDQGFVIADADLPETLGSRVISAPFAIVLDDATISVRVVNPFEKEAPVEECFLASAVCEEPGVDYGIFEGDYTIGAGEQDGFDEELLATAYKNEDNEIAFHTSPTAHLITGALEHPFGEQVLTDADRSMDLVFGYDGQGILQSIRMISPAYLYNGLEDNISEDELETMDEEQMTTAASLRDDILGQLSAAFEASGINVQIDQQKGTIRMDNQVLFATGEYALSDEGKAYLDSFIGVYASVILGDEFSEKIDAIEIEGHTDTQGSFEVNQELSENRANAVYEYCCSSANNGMDDTQRAQFTELAKTRGCSFNDPIFTENGDIDMDASRRVEMKFRIRMDAAGTDSGEGEAS